MVTAMRGIGSNNVQQTTLQAIQRGRLSRRDHLQLTSALLGDFTLSAADRSQINRVLDYIRMGRVELID